VTTGRKKEAAMDEEQPNEAEERLAVAEQCRGQSEGPIINRAGIVAWRRQCKRMTRDPSGYCPAHRGPRPYRTYRGR
jgi:hypothetical protein